MPSPFPLLSAMDAAPTIAETPMDPFPNVYVASMARDIPLLSAMSNAPTVRGPNYFNRRKVQLIGTF